MAAALGYFMFYARISDVYVGVITLTVTLIFYNLINSTAGPKYHIGDALLGGFNGMPNVPSLNVPFLPDNTLEPQNMFVLSMVLLLVVYFGLHWLLATRFGRVLVAVRENEQRVEFLGYDARLHKLVAFSIGGRLAGLAGCLFVVLGQLRKPDRFQRRPVGADHYLDHGGRRRHVARARVRCTCHLLADRRNRYPAMGQCQRCSGRDSADLRAARSKRRCADDQRPAGAVVVGIASPGCRSARSAARKPGMSAPLIETRQLSKH